MWDTAGQERYRSLIPTYLKNAHCVVLVFDITKAKTLQGLGDWFKLFTDNQQAPGIVVANKMDLSNIPSARKVSKNQAEQFCKNNQLRYMQVSAKSGKKIYQLFDTLLDMIVEKQKQQINCFTNNNNNLVNNGTTQNMQEAHQISNKKDSKIKLQKKGFKETVKGCCNSN